MKSNRLKFNCEKMTGIEYGETSDKSKWYMSFTEVVDPSWQDLPAKDLKITFNFNKLGNIIGQTINS